MKKRKEPRSYFVLLCAIAIGIVWNFSSCKNDDIPDESYYTFTGETAADYLKNHPEFSLYSEIVSRCKLTSSSSSGGAASLEALLSSYGYYTVFAPDNEAINTYLQKEGLESINQLTDSAMRLIACMHVINSTNNARSYESKYFTRKLADNNMYGKVIYVEAADNNYEVNGYARIVDRDIEVHNGYIHHIDQVLEPSDKKMDDFFNDNPQYSVFRLALNATGVAERVNTIPEDFDFVKDETDYSEYTMHDRFIEVPSKRLLYFTCFIEPNSVYEEAIPALQTAQTASDTLRLLQEYALDWFLDAYEGTDEVEAARNGTYPITDERNYFNKFVAYHFVNKKIDRVDFTRYGIGMEPQYARYKEFAETLAPGQMIHMSGGKNGNSLEDESILQLNPSPDHEVSSFAQKDWTRPSKDGVILSDRTTETENGFFHEVKSILTYPRKDFMKIRFRFDVSSLFPEIMSNDFRYKYEQQGRIVFPTGYLSNIDVLSPGTIILMISPNRSASGGYNGLQGDEFFAYNTYDFILRLPPVPAGQYEVRLGFSASEARGCAQFYLGTDKDNLTPCGIPVDLTLRANSYGFVDDTGTDEDYEVDKVMRAGGWMKGPDSWRCCNGNSPRSLRATEYPDGTGHSPLRHIMGVVNMDKDGPIYIRARNATTFTKVELMFDYFEICPANIYDNPLRPEPRD